MRTALMTAVLLASTACPLAAGEGSPFATPCTDACPEGFHCDAAEQVCVPGAATAEGEGEGEGEGEPALITGFTIVPDDVRPGESASFSVTVQGAVSCTVLNDALGILSIDPYLPTSLTMPTTPGDYPFFLTCIGQDQDPEPYPQSRSVHVRVLHLGDVVITDDESLVPFAGVEDVTGALLCSGCTATALDELDALRFVGGDVSFEGAVGLADLALPALETVGGGLLVDPGPQIADPMQELNLPSLLSLGADAAGFGLSVRGFNDLNDDGLEAIRAPLLTTIGGNVLLGGYDYPSFPALTDVEDRGLHDLGVLDLSALVSIDGWLDIEEDDALGTIALPALQSVTGTLVVYGNDATAVAFDALQTVGGIVIASNPALASVAFPELTAITLPAADDFQTAVYQAFYDEVEEPGFFRAGDFLLDDNDAMGFATTNASIVALDLDHLATSVGRVRISETSLDAIDLAALRSARGLEAAINGPAQTIDLSALETLGPDGLFINDTDAEVLGLQSLASVEGDFRVIQVFSIPAVLPALTTIGGELDTDELPDGITPFSALQSVGTLSNEDNGGPATFTGLSPTISIGTLRVRTSVMTRLEGLPAPTTLLDVRDNAQLDVIDLANPGAAILTSVTITGNATLDSVRLAVPSVGTGITITGNSALASIDLGTVASAGPVVIDSTALTALDLCSLTTVASLSLRNTDLTTLDGLAALDTCPALTATGNAALPSCMVDALAAQCGSVTLNNTGNSSAVPAPCVIDPAPICGG